MSSCKTVDEYRALNDYKDATVNFERGYEGSADWANDKCASRIAFADAFYSAFKSTITTKDIHTNSRRFDYEQIQLFRSNDRWH